MPITIEEAIARIPTWRHASLASVSLLPGGITNVNYRVDVGGEAFVVRIGARNADLLGIDREREFQCTVAASRTGVAPEVVRFLPEDDILVTRFIAGRSLSPAEMAGPETMARVVRSMRLYHGGPAFAGSFSPFRTVEGYLRVARRYGAPLPDDIDALFARMPPIEAALGRGRSIMCPCHNDLWEPNLIDDGTLIRIVDWEYAAMGDASFDLANFAIHHDLSGVQEEALLRTYFGAATEPRFARLKLMEIVAELREAMWCMAAVNISEIEFDFTGYARIHFDRSRRALDDPRLAEWLDMATRGG